MEFFYSSGLRLAELVGLNLRDLDLVDRPVRVLGKGNPDRIVHVGPMAASALRRYLTKRNGQQKKARAHLSLAEMAGAWTGERCSYAQHPRLAMLA